ncbi:hypothetical protein KRMM14A1259_44920 [Krasilnikovia sp. MM14-A1259]
MSRDHAFKVWSRLSERYAQQAQGDTAWSHSPRPDSIWNTAERSALEANPDVMKITVIEVTDRVERRPCQYGSVLLSSVMRSVGRPTAVAPASSPSLRAAGRRRRRQGRCRAGRWR